MNAQKKARKSKKSLQTEEKVNRLKIQPWVNTSTKELNIFRAFVTSLACNSGLLQKNNTVFQERKYTFTTRERSVAATTCMQYVRFTLILNLLDITLARLYNKRNLISPHSYLIPTILPSKRNNSCSSTVKKVVCPVIYRLKNGQQHVRHLCQSVLRSTLAPGLARQCFATQNGDASHQF